MKHQVRITMELEVELPDGADAQFILVENGCPGTGVVGRELEDQILKHTLAGTCYGCSLKGKVELLK